MALLHVLLELSFFSFVVFDLLVDLTNLGLYIFYFVLEFLVQVSVTSHAAHQLAVLVSLLSTSLLDNNGLLFETALGTVAVGVATYHVLESLDALIGYCHRLFLFALFHLMAYKFVQN